jgi:hypothetical protein
MTQFMAADYAMAFVFVSMGILILALAWKVVR